MPPFDTPIRICLVGASGRMGQEVILAAQRAAESGRKVAVVCSVSQGTVDPIADSNVIIDFSSPTGTEQAIKLASTNRIPLLVCTTGLGPQVEEQLQRLSQEQPVIRTSNTSICVTAMLDLVQHAARLLGEEFDVEVVEAHHRWKKDSPSGTAISLAQAIGAERGMKYPDDYSLGRGVLSEARRPGEIGIQAVRGGDLAGEHTVMFLGRGERIEITQRATARSVFAEGALRAAQWLVSQAERGKSGLYSMSDVLRGA